LFFSCNEVGTVSEKNTKNILMKNIGDAAIGAICWWLFGFGFAFGETSGGFIGTDEFLLNQRMELSLMENNMLFGYSSLLLRPRLLQLFQGQWLNGFRSMLI